MATLIIRLALGVIFVAHGAQKLLGWWGGAGFAGTIAQLTKMGMLAPLAVLVIVAEFFGGLGILFGALTRLAAFGIACVMVGGSSPCTCETAFSSTGPTSPGAVTGSRRTWPTWRWRWRCA